ncbi:MAG: hypothetical protein MOGMAGMI_01623 [Candidatus Omnitrophica bacterium]|nr:hypothetical protein [Candidatus Omnitrophota bacterium]
MTSRRFSRYFYNPVSYLGALLALLVFIVEIFLFALDMFVGEGNLYIGILTYCILPIFLIIGLLMIAAGAIVQRIRYVRGQTDLRIHAFHIDLSLPSHQNTLIVFFVGTAILIIMTLIGSYKAYHYTESVQFCGTMCHEVMRPEHTAYLKSPHGRVACVECHIGSGANWYVKSKMSGARQVLRTIAKSYERPIKTPVDNLRPAEQTCQQCHWPEKLHAIRDLKRSYYLTEGDDREWVVRMQMNVGGDKDSAAGVHAHMNVDHEIYYAAEDARRQKITWVKSVDKDGTERIYVSPGSKYRDAPPPADKVRKMDCIDCHNRPSHRFEAPYRLVNDALRQGRIDPSIPDIKERALKALDKEYDSTAEALESIPSDLRAYYEKKHPDYLREHSGAIDTAAETLKRLYQNDFFPEMKARWDTHPDNIGHLTTPGCFRCHGGEHRTLDGARTITKDCKACHTIVEQGPAGRTERSLDGLDFIHPVDDDNGWKEMNCHDCHTGGGP